MYYTDFKFEINEYSDILKEICVKRKKVELEFILSLDKILLGYSF